MNTHENLIRSTVTFITDRYLEPYKKSKIPPKMTKWKLSMPEQSILDAVASAAPYHIADEVLFFYLAINEQLVNQGEYLLGNETSMFPLFPFPLVFPPLELPFSQCIDLIESWKNIEPYIDLFLMDGSFLRSPRLDRKREQAPIYCAGKFEIDELGFMVYSSLTNLLLMIAECYVTGAYYYHKPSTYGTWKEDFSKSEVIFHKYHPELPFRSPHEWEHFCEENFEFNSTERFFY